MASSQVEIASSSPFGCVLKDRNRRKGMFRESNGRANFDNPKEFVRVHIHNRINIYDENSQCHHQGDNNIADESMMSPRQSRILDKWAAKQAEEMVSAIEKQSHEGEMLAQSSSSLSSVGASSLVQMWEARFSRYNSSKTTSGLSSIHMETAAPSSPNSAVINENDSSVDSEESTRVASIANQDENNSINNNDNNSNDDDNNNSEDTSERERVKVADIIRRLKLGDQTLASARDDCNDQNLSASSTPRIGENSSVMMDGAEHIGSSQSRLPSIRTPTSVCASFQLEERRLTNTPRVRGRQAFNDLLMQMERDRHMELGNLVERRAVSKFSQKGRIQSMLRLKLLQRGLAAVQEDYQRSYSSRITSPSNCSQRSAITHLRSRFDTVVEQQNGAVVNSNGESSPSGEAIVTTRDDSETFPPRNQLNEDNREEVNIIEQHRPPPESDASEDHHDQGSLISDATWLDGGPEVRNLDTQETERNFWEEEVNEEEGAEADAPQDMVIQYDWISEISRPRRYWEDRRQAWYQEILASHSVNEDIRQLLQRRTVSSFLSSDFRQKMDQLMMSRVNLRTYREHQRSEGPQSENHDRMEQITISLLQRHTHSAGPSEEVQDLDQRQDLEEEVEEEEQEDEEGEENSIAQGYNAVTDYYDQTQTSPQLPVQSPISSWSSYRDLEIGDDFDQAASTSDFRHSHPSQSYLPVTRQTSSSSTNCPSIEMELIYDLRWQMEQLHQEMSELRRSITSFMDMQGKLQQSFKQESRPGHRYGKRPFHWMTKKKKGSCCICYEMAVDSLLYRCGHMCTCLKCAHELQWSSAKCPICRAPIVDVVRAYANDS